MLGAVLMIVVMVVVVPVAIMFGGAIWSALFGWVSSEDADRRNQGDGA
jgi:membrane glycosyltransferase